MPHTPHAILSRQPIDGLRWPVFVRSATMSLPPLSDLLATRSDLDGALARLVDAGHPPEDLLIIEHCAEPFAPGLYRKQAEYRIGDRYVPNASIYAAEWYVKRSTSVIVDDSHIAFDMAVMRDNPYADLAREVFAIAGVEYGRIDIGIGQAGSARAAELRPTRHIGRRRRQGRYEHDRRPFHG